MVQTDDVEKAEFKQTALGRGFNAVSVWLKWLGKNDQRKLKKEESNA